jgi:hypothetical protein
MNTKKETQLIAESPRYHYITYLLSCTATFLQFNSVQKVRFSNLSEKVEVEQVEQKEQGFLYNPITEYIYITLLYISSLF